MIQAISRGGLTVLSDRWMDIWNLELLFSLVLGSTVSREPGIVRRLVELLEEWPDLDKRVARKLAVTRLHVRLRWLNCEEAATRYRNVE